MKPSPFIYFDLDLWFSQEGNRFRVDLQSKLGPAMATFQLPFASEEIQRVFVAMGHARRVQTVRRGNSPELQATKNFGEKLFNTVFEDILRKALFESIKDARDQGARLRIRLHMEKTPALAELPWECLFTPSEGFGFFALSIDTPLVRYFMPQQQVAPLRIAPPLRILVMIACPTDHMPLDADSEWSSLQRAVEPLQRQGLVDLVRLPCGTVSALQDELSRREYTYHVLHFIGHGDFRKEGVLVTEGEDQPSACISGDELAVLLRDHKSLRLVVLNACEGGRATPSDPFVGVAQRLVQDGVPAVIGMQFEISDKGAVEFARRFYRAAAEGYPIDAAVSEARKALFATGSLEWATPVLYLRAADTAIFQIFEQGMSTARLEAATALSETDATAAISQTGRKPREKRAILILIAAVLLLIIVVGVVKLIVPSSQQSITGPTTADASPQNEKPIGGESWELGAVVMVERHLRDHVTVPSDLAISKVGATERWICLAVVVDLARQKEAEIELNEVLRKLEPKVSKPFGARQIEVVIIAQQLPRKGDEIDRTELRRFAAYFDPTDKAPELRNTKAPEPEPCSGTLRWEGDHIVLEDDTGSLLRISRNQNEGLRIAATQKVRIEASVRRAKDGYELSKIKEK
ncbi:MAG TPA: CHAT domain-containing protein [Chthoniobacterales bacterium]|nr:CHAT domain-containing protein [Chthoniobacterales bacterium]